MEEEATGTAELTNALAYASRRPALRACRKDSETSLICGLVDCTASGAFGAKQLDVCASATPK